MLVSPWSDTGDLPIAGDFDNDGFEDDIAVFRPSESRWYFDLDHDAQTDFRIEQWGNVGDLPLSGDFNHAPFLKQISGTRKVVAILIDPHRPEHPAPPLSDVDNDLFASQNSVRDYYMENSGGKFTIEKAYTLGWYDTEYSWDLYWRSGDYQPSKWIGTERYIEIDGKPYYIDNDGFIGGHMHRWAEAIRRAAAEIDFAAYDANADRILEPNELAILVITPQNKDFGTIRSVVGRQHPSVEPLIVDGVTIKTISEAYIGTSPSLGVLAHELAHLLLNTEDMYHNQISNPYSPGVYSLMDTSPGQPLHLDPFHKLKLGWLDAIEIFSPGVYTLKNVEQFNEVAVLPRLTKNGFSSREYFLIENRYPGNSYDKGAPDSGLAVWHIMENPDDLVSLNPPRGVTREEWSTIPRRNWARRGVRLLRSTFGHNDSQALWKLSADGDAANLLSTFEQREFNPCFKLLVDFDAEGKFDQLQSNVGTLDTLGVSGDFDRDGVVDDLVYFEPKLRRWEFDFDNDGTYDMVIFGWGDVGDLPVSGDFDNDSYHDDIAVFRASDKEWYFDYNHDGITDLRIKPWGDVGDLPLSGDFDRDGFINDIAILRPSDREWYFDYNADGTTDKRVKPWGDFGDIPLAGDFDGDKAVDDIAVFRRQTGDLWIDLNHDGNTDQRIRSYGMFYDRPTAGDFDKDGFFDDVALFRPVQHHVSLKWADGSPSDYSIRNISLPGSIMNFEVIFSPIRLTVVLSGGNKPFVSAPVVPYGIEMMKSTELGEWSNESFVLHNEYEFFYWANTIPHKQAYFIVRWSWD